MSETNAAIDIEQAARLLLELKKSASPEELVALHKALLPSSESVLASPSLPVNEQDRDKPTFSKKKIDVPPRSASMPPKTSKPSKSGKAYSAPPSLYDEDHPDADPDPLEDFPGTPLYNESREHMVQDLGALQLDKVPWGNYPDSRDLYDSFPFPMPIGGWSHDQKTDFRKSVADWLPEKYKVYATSHGKDITNIQDDLWAKRRAMRIDHWTKHFAPFGHYMVRDRPVASARDDTLRGEATTRPLSPDNRARLVAEGKLTYPGPSTAFVVSGRCHPRHTERLDGLNMIAPRVTVGPFERDTYIQERYVEVPPHWRPRTKEPFSAPTEDERGREIQVRRSEPRRQSPTGGPATQSQQEPMLAPEEDTRGRDSQARRSEPGREPRTGGLEPQAQQKRTLSAARSSGSRSASSGAPGRKRSRPIVLD